MSSDCPPRVSFKLIYPVSQGVAHKCLARALLKGLFKKSLLRICQQISTECLISVANLRKVHPKKVVRNPQYIGKLILGLHFTMFHPIFHPLQSCPTWLKSLVRSVRSSQSIKVLVPGLRSSSSIFKNLGWNSLSYLHGKTQLWNESS